MVPDRNTIKALGQTHLTGFPVSTEVGFFNASFRVWADAGLGARELGQATWKEPGAQTPGPRDPVFFFWGDVMLGGVWRRLFVEENDSQVDIKIRGIQTRVVFLSVST